MPKTLNMSASSIRTFMSCRRKYYFQYIEQLQPIVRETPLSFGSAVHAGMEYLFKTGPSVPYSRDAVRKAIEASYTPDELIQSGANPLVALECVEAFDRMINWRERWEFITVEPWHELKIGRGRNMRMRFDGIVKIGGAVYIIDHKTVAGAVTERKLHHLMWDIQAGLYIACARELGIPAIGMLYNFLPKPTISQGTATPMEKRKYTKEGKLYANMREQDETVDEYVARVHEWYLVNNGGDFFRQHVVTRNDSQINAMLEQVKKIGADMRAAERLDAYYMNPSACELLGCPFASVCLEDTPEAREGNFTKRGEQKQINEALTEL